MSNNLNFIHSQIHQKMKTTQMFTNKWMDKQLLYIHIMECYSVKKRNELWMNFEIIMQNKIR